MQTRRALVAAIAASLALVTLDAEAVPPAARRRRRTRRTVRRRVRRRHRRRVRRRVVAGRSYLVVPVALAVGWELAFDDQVWVVTRIHVVEGTETVELKATDGTTASEPIVREDTTDNTTELEGSELPEGDTATPGVDSEA